jgi:hypothetical protein
MTLPGRLRQRRTRLEQDLLARVYAVSDPNGVDDPDYVIGLRETVSVALDYGIEAVEAGEALPASPPGQLPEQARSAARNGVPLDTVLRRYYCGHTLLSEFLIQQTRGDDGARTAELADVLRRLSAVFDRLVATIASAHTEESRSRFKTAERRRHERICRLLLGEAEGLPDLHYDLAGWHLAGVTSGPGAVEAMRELAASCGASLLLARPEVGTAWAWLGTRDRPSSHRVLRLAKRSMPETALLALGEPAHGVEGWRRTHRQATAAMSVARRSPERLLPYTDVALLAAALRDDLLESSLQELYLAPLERGRDGGELLLKTASAYFAEGRNASSAGTALGVSRKTVSTRLQALGERLGRPVDACGAELETALRLRALSREPDRGR